MTVNFAKSRPDLLKQLEDRISTWSRMKQVVSIMLNYKSIVRRRTRKDILDVNKPLFGSEPLHQSEIEIVKMAQQRRFSAEFKILTAAKVGKKCDVPFRKSSVINQLDPFLNSDDIICVGGRLKRSFLNKELKFPIIWSKEERIATLIIQDCHSRCAHGGRGAILNGFHSRGYWITNGNSAVRSVIFKYILCHRLRGRVGVQKMAELPMHRLSDSPPFTYCGVNMFVPFSAKQCRNEVKCYSAMFTCMRSRAVYTEITHSLDTDSFIQALRTVIARRENIKTLFSGNGSNFICCENELKKAY